MAQLNNTIAVDKSYLELLEQQTGKMLQSAKEVTDDLEKINQTIDKAIEDLPVGVKRTGTQRTIAEASKFAKGSRYISVKSEINKELKKLKEDVPRYDKTCGDVADKLTTVAKSVKNRIEDLEDFLSNGGFNCDPKTFSETLEQYKSNWDDEVEALKKLLYEIKNALKGIAVEACCYSADPVNLATGNFVYDREDLKIGGAVPLSFHRYYNSLDDRDSVLGRKWRHNYEVCLLLDESCVTVLREDGREDCFQDKEGVFVSVTGSVHTLKVVEGQYRYEEKNGSIYTFDESGLLVTLSDNNRNCIHFQYDKNRRLECVQSQSGSLFYCYDENGQLVKVQDHADRTVEMLYEEGRLCQVTTPMKVNYTYLYDMDGNLKSVVNPQDVVTVKNRFDKDGRTKKQFFPDGGTMRFSYDDDQNMVTLTERNGAKIAYEHDNRYRNVRTIYSDGEETYRYNKNGQRTAYTDKNGNTTKYSYDNMGNITKIMDAAGNTTHITYGGHRKPIRIKAPDGGQWKFHYDDMENLVKQEDANGNVTEIVYNEQGRITKIIQADNAEINISYDEKGNPVTVVRPDGAKVSYRYDSCNRVIETTDENGNVTRYVYDAADRITEVTNPEGNTRYYSYNSSGMVTEIKDFDGRAITRGYNCLNKLAWETDKEGNTTHYEYDLMWNVSRQTLANGGEIHYQYNELNHLECLTNPLGGKLFYQYDANGNIIHVENEEKAAIGYEYNELNQRISVTDALGNVSRTYYDSMGRVIREVDAMGRTFDIVYDLNGNKVAEHNSVNGGMTYTYDCMGRIATMTDGVGRVRKYVYDVCGRIQQLEDFDGTIECYSYDPKGNMTLKKDKNGVEYHYVYDNMDRVARVEKEGTIFQCFTYDALGKCTSMTDANGNCTEYGYTPNGNMNRVVDALGNETAYCYDSMGQLEQVVYPSEQKERTTTYVRNLAGQVTGITDALGYTEYYEYDCYGKLVRKTDRNGQNTVMNYNAMGDVTHIQYADEKEVYLSYNPLRQLKELQDWTGTTQILLDDIGRTHEITDSMGNKVAYEWGVLGQRTGIIYPDGQKVSYEYDQYLNLEKVIAQEDVITYYYDTYGHLSEKRYSNGMCSRYSYTADGRLESLIHKNGDELIDRFVYGYDRTGNCISEERTRKDMPEVSGCYQYAFDALGRLTAVEKDGALQSSYEYDAYGNRVLETRNGETYQYAYNQANQLIRKEGKLDAQEYLYNPNGSLVKILSAGDTQAEYQYDSMGYMIFAKTQKGVAEYQYNGFGKKIHRESRMSKDNRLGEATGTSYILDYTRDYNNLLQRKQGSHQDSYFWDDNLLMSTSSEVSSLTASVAGQQPNMSNMTYLLDFLGSPIRLCGDAGNVVETYSYDVFGEDASLGAISQPFGFTGYERDEVSGLYYAQARQYDAQTGRFTSRDIVKGYVGHPMSQNEYTYCLENPLLYVDRDGRVPNTQSKHNYMEIPGGNTDSDMNSGSTGGYVSVGAIIGVTVKIKQAYDDKGNTVPQIEVSIGPGVGEEAHIGVTQSVSSADSVDDMAGVSYGVGGSFYVGAGCGVDVSYSQDDEGYLDVAEVTMRSGVGEGVMADVFVSYTWNLNYFKKSAEASKE